MGFTLSLLIFFVLVRFVLPRVLRAVLGGFVRQQVHKAQQGGFYPPSGFPGGSYQAPPQSESAARPGQVRVEYMPPTSSTGERKPEFRGGEYVDYEEV
ncbi:hypothetical protein GCM10023172_18920 [Hymenobacter ginsengisoli]|uniref:DUF4834 domain-containing protein n=1 Tax=Hymenobacter ginsengisoli TaxID=1051626 RepID=A0ABP8QCQ7_9BACT|nr:MULTISPECIES: hypothetical protein [unclassified Hymenobacter]MBO2031549.1 hypothetical protein [Hymenobacter sp. BT559]